MARVVVCIKNSRSTRNLRTKNKKCKAIPLLVTRNENFPTLEKNLKAPNFRRKLLDAAAAARVNDDYEDFDEVWKKMSRLEKALYDVEEWEDELKRIEVGRERLGSFMPESPPKEELARLEELERACGDPALIARIERVRQTRCFCDGPDFD